MKAGKLHITIVGFGNVGQAIGGMLMATDFPLILNVMDPSQKVVGAVLDLKQAAVTFGAKEVCLNDEQEFAEANYVIHTAGGQIPTGGDRMTVSGASIDIARQVFEGVQFKSKPIILVVANPVDVVSWFVKEFSGVSGEQVLGMGTSVDCLRLGDYLSEELDIPADEINTWVLGEHGVHMVPIWSHTLAQGKPVQSLLDAQKLEELRQATIYTPLKIKETADASVFPVCLLSIKLILGLERGKEDVLPLSAYLNKENQKLFDTEAIFLSVPVKIYNGKIQQVQGFDYAEEELQKMKRSADIVRHTSQLYKRYYDID
jgi:malate/lactate dehydrogenase